MSKMNIFQKLDSSVRFWEWFYWKIISYLMNSCTYCEWCPTKCPNNYVPLFCPLPVNVQMPTSLNTVFLFPNIHGWFQKVQTRQIHVLLMKYKQKNRLWNWKVSWENKMVIYQNILSNILNLMISGRIGKICKNQAFWHFD